MQSKTRTATVSVLTLSLCMALVSVAEAKGPIWQIYKAGTNQSIKWKTHAANPRFAKWKAGTPSDPSDDIILDRQTGLVWERQPSTTRRDWDSACDYCCNKEVGNRKGWRLPTIEELTSLVDDDNNSPALPTGSPFNVVGSYWSSTTSPLDTDQAYDVYIGNGTVSDYDKTQDDPVKAWCVRGGQGHDAY